MPGIANNWWQQQHVLFPLPAIFAGQQGEGGQHVLFLSPAMFVDQQGEGGGNQAANVQTVATCAFSPMSVSLEPVLAKKIQLSSAGTKTVAANAEACWADLNANACAFKLCRLHPSLYIH